METGIQDSAISSESDIEDGPPKLVPDSARMRPRRRLVRRPGNPRLALERSEDDRLAASIAEVGAEPFELLYQRYQQPLFRYCCGILGNRTEAEDALQEAMLSAYQSLLKHRGPIRFKPWIYSIARNACIDRIRQRKRVADQEPTEELLDTVPSVETSSEMRELMHDLLTDMTELSERQRSALLLREMSGFSHEEISDVLETSPTKCKSLISEARQALTDRALGREMPCSELRDAVEANGRRVLHGRRLSAHVSGCHTCNDFVTHRREHALAAFMPVLPIIEARGLLQRIFESGPAAEAAAGGGLVAAVSALGAKKLLATVAIVSAVGAGASQVPAGSDRAAKQSGEVSAASKASSSSDDAAKAKADGQATAQPSDSAKTSPATAGLRSAPTRSTAPVAGPIQPDADHGKAAGQVSAPLTDRVGEVKGQVDKAVDQTKSAVQDAKRTVDEAVGQTGGAVEQTIDTAAGAVDDAPVLLGR